MFDQQSVGIDPKSVNLCSYNRGWERVNEGCLLPRGSRLNCSRTKRQPAQQIAYLPEEVSDATKGACKCAHSNVVAVSRCSLSRMTSWLATIS